MTVVRFLILLLVSLAVVAWLHPRRPAPMRLDYMIRVQPQPIDFTSPNPDLP